MITPIGIRKLHVIIIRSEVANFFITTACGSSKVTAAHGVCMEFSSFFGNKAGGARQYGR